MQGFSGVLALKSFRYCSEDCEKLAHPLNIGAAFPLWDRCRYVRMWVRLSRMEKLFRGKRSSRLSRSPPVVVQGAVSFTNLEIVS